MVLTRAQNQPGPDGVLATPPRRRRERDDIQDATNTDSPWVDQSQTYTSHPSHQVFLREYVNNAAGRPVSTGKLLGGLPARRRRHGHLGDDQGPGARPARPQARPTRTSPNIPMIAADPYGKFIPGPLRGLPQYVTQTGLVEGNLADPGAGPGRRAALRHAVPDRHRAQRRPVAAGHGPQPGHAAGRADAGRRPRRPRPTSPTSRPGPTTTRCSTRTSSPVTAGSTRTSA